MYYRSLKWGRIVMMVIVVLLWCHLSVTAQECGDVNGDGQVDSTDATALFEYFRFGTPVAADSAHLEFDRRIGLTIGDLMSGYFCIAEPSDSTCSCSADLEYSYSLSTQDTVFFPRLLDIPPDVDTVRLPIVTTLQVGYREYAVNLPYLPVSAQSDAVFQPLNANYRSGDTALVVDVGLSRYFGGRRIVEDLVYVRTQAGPGAIVPELVDSWDGKRMAFTFMDASTERHDLTVPVVLTYDVHLCCETTYGDLNCPPDGTVDISDLTILVNHLFVTMEPLCCPTAGNVNGDMQGNVDISDLIALIYPMFVDFRPPQPCLY